MRRESCIEGFDEALALEREWRESAFLAETTTICGIRVYHVTPALLARLFRIETPFLVGGDYTLTAAIQFLWAISIDFKEDDAEALDAFIVNSVAANNPELPELYDAIDEYLDATFLDAHLSGKSESIPYICSVAWMVYVMACEPFKWDEQRTLKSPLRRIYQYLKCAKWAKGDIASLHNAKSQPIMDNWILQIRKNLGQN